jgi:hypothetical protein
VSVSWQTSTNTRRNIDINIAEVVFDKLPNVDMCFKVFSTQHPYDAYIQTKMTILALKKKNVRVVGMGVCLPLRVTAVTILALKKKNVRVVGMGVCLPLRVTAVTICPLITCLL